jgi:hypothetical protein
MFIPSSYLVTEENVPNANTVTFVECPYCKGMFAIPKEEFDSIDISCCDDKRCIAAYNAEKLQETTSTSAESDVIKKALGQ